ncbi:iron-sulfur cluster repair di-iron protein [Aquimarina algicola]|uniref:Iron-sulfur cluster repair di-iron protein n=1 Tax=Aquimarina algicola TaxID=2589995 RepID=A0A504JFF9_9FLAO|nr:iron-sulfur cluster repair di-iron protein [Aquimarina algicola]TPN87215.1 iron-sulfur cluster repair di-iron protein [Aquimarina algicola]
MKICKETLVSDIVAEDYKYATIFKNHQIDFCCNGNRTIAEVCQNNDLIIEQLIEELNIDTELKKDVNDYQSWDIGFLSDYIYNNHHKYVENKIPEIKQYLDKLCKVHGQNHPELFKIRELFTDSADELTKHMKKEELILFPYFKKLVKAKKGNKVDVSISFNSVENPIAMMHEEHDNEGHRFRIISSISNNYTPPEDACTTYKVAFSMLQEFEEDLHKHIHLENNILFRKAIETENSLK